MKNSRRKGQRGERELAALLSYHGFPARRGQQYKGGPESPDIESPTMSMLGFHIECKRSETLRLSEWLAQVDKEKGNKCPLVFWKKNNHPWVVLTDAEAFLDWLAVMCSATGEDDDDGGEGVECEEV